MFLLAVLCTSITCKAAFSAEAVAHTYEECIRIGEEKHASDGVTWLCVRDLPIDRRWSEFE